MTLDPRTPGKKPSVFRLTAPPAPKEHDLQGQILDYLRLQQARGRVIWYCRVNSGSVKAGMRWVRFYLLYLAGRAYTTRGKGDIEGMLPGGRYFALEVKKPGEKATPEQLDFLAAVRDGGGIAAVVRGYEDVPSLLFGEINPCRE